MSEKKKYTPMPLITQESVERLSHANTMEDFLLLAEEENVDWDEMPDEWLDAIAQGDVTELIRQLKYKPKKGKR